MAEGKKRIMFYADWMEQFTDLTDEEAGKLIKHIMQYLNDLNPEAPDRLTTLLFKPFEKQFKRDLVKYEDFIDKQRENGSKGGRPNKTQKTQAFISKPKKADKDKVKDKVKDKEIESSVVRFKPPTILEVKDYISEMKYGMDANRFVDFYESKGWMVGKNKMKDWKAAVRSWESADKKQNKDSVKGIPGKVYH